MDVREISYKPNQIDSNLNDLFESITRQGPEKVLWLTPTRRLIRDRTARYAAFIKQKGIRGTLLPNFSTINDLAVTRFQMANPNYAFISKDEQDWLVDEAILKVFERQIVGLSRETLALISNFKEYLSSDVSVIKDLVKKSLKDWKESFTPMLDAGVYSRIEERIEKILLILQKYEKIKKERKIFDEIDALYGADEPNQTNQTIILDSFQEFFPAQQEYLNRLMKNAGEVIYLKPSIETPDGGFLNLEGISGKLALSLQKHLTPSAEIEEVVVQIASLINAGVRPEEILVVVPELSQYARIIKAKLATRGIETNISQGYPLSNSSVGGFLSSVVQYLDDNSQPGNFLDLVLSFLFFELAAKNPDYEKELLDFLRKEDFYQKDVFIEKAINKFKERNLEDFAQILEAVNRLKYSTNMEEAINRIEEIVVLSYETIEWKSGYERDVEAILDGINSYKNSYLFKLDKKKPFDFRKLRSVILSILSKPSKVFSGDIGRGVQVTGVLETRGIASDFIFVCGLTDRAFPGKPLKNFILPDDIKRRLGIPTTDEYLAKQKTDFYRLLSSARYGVFLSYYEKEKNEVLLESRFLTELKTLINRGRVTGISLLKPEDLTVSSKNKISIDIFSYKDLDYEEQWNKQKEEKSIVIRVSDIVKIIDCELMFFLNFRGFQPIQLPGEEPKIYRLSVAFHELASDFVDFISINKVKYSFEIYEWTKNWLKSNIEEGKYAKYDFPGFYGKVRIEQSAYNLIQILNNYTTKNLELIPERSLNNLEKKVRVSDGDKILEATIVGRPDLIVFDRYGNLSEIIDLKLDETIPKEKNRNKMDKYAHQLLLYMFLLSEKADLETFVPKNIGTIIQIILGKGTAEKE
ncbi:MAG: PD-(D/E)XK nuclease family protein, partial [Actinobacteria bacterium]|nr:PD-(D/E)XK nuclease family protein [Actinomycetota bacterium]